MKVRYRVLLSVGIFVLATLIVMSAAEKPLSSDNCEPEAAQTSGETHVGARKTCDGDNLSCENKCYTVLKVYGKSDNGTNRNNIFYVDSVTYEGWLTYRSFCYICHTDAATGDKVVDVVTKTNGERKVVCSANLIEKFRSENYSLSHFSAVVAEGIAPGMPPWKDSAIVSERYVSLYAYLRALANDDLPLPKPGDRPLRLLPADGYDLRLMSIDARDYLEDDGKSLVIVALVGTDLHIRIFDANGKKVVDRAENELIPGAALLALKERLSPIPDESSLSQADKQEIIGYATSSAGHTPADIASINTSDCIRQTRGIDGMQAETN